MGWLLFAVALRAVVQLLCLTKRQHVDGKASLNAGPKLLYAVLARFALRKAGLHYPSSTGGTSGNLYLQMVMLGCCRWHIVKFFTHRVGA